MKKVIAMLLALAMLLSMVACSSKQDAQDDTAATDSGTTDTAENEDTSSDASESGDQGYKVGFSNSYNGNTFRQTLEASFKETADELVAQGVVSDYTMAVTNNDNTQQISQIQSMVLDGCDIIIIDPGSATALNDAIDEAVEAGVVVFVVSDGPVTTDSCYQLNTDGYAAFAEATEEICKLAGDGKDALLIRGITGLEIEQLFYEGEYDTLMEHGYNVVGEVEGQWTDSVAKEALAAVLPSLNYDVDVILGQGGDDLVAAELFEEAGKEVHMILGSNRGGFLSWWANAYETSGYQTASTASDPCVASVALLIAVDILDGKVTIDEKEMYCGGTLITQDMMEENLEMFKNFDPDGMYYEQHDHQWIVDNIYSTYSTYTG